MSDRDLLGWYCYCGKTLQATYEKIPNQNRNYIECVYCKVKYEKPPINHLVSYEEAAAIAKGQK